jgi:hypothetical protein
MPTPALSVYFICFLLFRLRVSEATFLHVLRKLLSEENR